MDKRQCSQCGAPFKDSDRVCSYCGTARPKDESKVETNIEEKKDKNIYTKMFKGLGVGGRVLENMLDDLLDDLLD